MNTFVEIINSDIRFAEKNTDRIYVCQNQRQDKIVFENFLLVYLFLNSCIEKSIILVNSESRVISECVAILQEKKYSIEQEKMDWEYQKVIYNNLTGKRNIFTAMDKAFKVCHQVCNIIQDMVKEIYLHTRRVMCLEYLCKQWFKKRKTSIWLQGQDNQCNLSKIQSYNIGGTGFWFASSLC